MIILDAANSDEEIGSYLHATLTAKNGEKFKGTARLDSNDCYHFDFAFDL